MIKKISKSSYTIIGLFVAVSAMMTYSFTGAQNTWTAPPATPPQGNVEAPINVGPNAQVKAGNIGANILAASSSVWSDMYCDGAGQNCNPIGTPESGNGNEIVWLRSVGELFPASRGTKVVSLVSLGYPSNAIRVLLSVSSPSECRNNGNGRDPEPTTCVHAEIDLRQNIAGRAFSTPISANGLPTWFTINTNTLTFGQKVPPGLPGGRAEILAYECQGKCEDGVTAGSCSVEFNWSFPSGQSSKTVAVRGNVGETMAVGLNYDKDDWEWRPYIGNAYTEQVGQGSWGSSWRDSAERAMVGYFDPTLYSARASVINGYNSHNHIRTAPLRMTVGRTVTLRNAGVEDIPAGALTVTARVASCTR